MPIQRAVDPINIRRGDTFWKDYQLFKGEDQEDRTKFVDLSNVELKSQCRVDPNASVMIDFPITMIDATKGHFQIKMSPTETKQLGAVGKDHAGVYDIQMKDKTTGDVFTFVTGSVTITDDITYVGNAKSNEFLL